MTALTADRNTPVRDNIIDVYDVAAGVKIYAGSMVGLDASGNAKPFVVATDLICVGRAEEAVNNSTGSAGDVQVRVRHGIFRWANSGSTDTITKAHIGDICYGVDDATVALTSGTSTRSAAGTVFFVDTSGVWVKSTI